MTDAGSFGGLLRRHRHTAALTIEDLSAASGVSVRAIGDMERGRSRGPQRRTVAALADALRLALPDREEMENAARAGRPRTATATSGGGCELPRRVGDFTGRQAELDWIERLAAAAGDDGPATIAAISGGPGMGKSALVVHAAEQLAGYFPDGRLFIDLRGMDATPVGTGVALSRLLKVFGVAEARIPVDEEERAGLYRSLLADRRSLIVLDNAVDEAHVRSLLPGGGGSLVLVTSRRSLAGLEGVHQLLLTGMPPEDAVQMLRGIVGQGREADGDLDAVADLCGNLPLAMRIAGNRLLSRPGWTAGHLAARLADEERRLDLLSAGDLHVAAAFALSYRHLSVRAAELFRRLGLVPGPDFGVAMGAVLAGSGLDDAEDALEELVDLGLLQAPYLGRYRLHDLVRLYARARLADGDPGTQDAVRRRMNDWLLDVTVVAGRWFEPGYGEPLVLYDGLVPLDTRDEAHAWLEGESANWLAALRSAAADDRHARVVEVAGAMHWFSDRLIHWSAWREVFELSSNAAHAMGDRQEEVVHLNYLAWALSYCEGRHQDGVDCALRAHDLARELGDLSEQAWALQYAGMALRNIGDSWERAGAYAREAVALFQAAGDWDGYYQGVGSVGDSLRHLGRPEEALRHYLALLDELRDPAAKGTAHIRQIGIGRTLARIGRTHAALGNWREAAASLRASLPLVREHDSMIEIADRYYELGQVLRELGDIPATRAALNDALAGYRSLGDERAETVAKEIASLDT